MPQTPEDLSHSGDTAEQSGHEKARCSRKSAAHRYRWNCCSCELLSPCADRDRSRGAEDTARPSSQDKPSSKVAAICNELSPSYSDEIVAATYGQPRDSHPRHQDFKVVGSEHRTPASLSVTSLTDHPSHSGKVIPKSKEWMILDETQKLSSRRKHYSKVVTTRAIKKQWSYDEQATGSVDLSGNPLISSKHTYIPNTCIGDNGKSLNQLHSDAAASNDTCHNNKIEGITSRIVISKGLSCSELIPAKTEMPFSEMALSAELLDIQSNGLSCTNLNGQISSDFSASSSDFINGRQITKSDSSFLEDYCGSGKVCLEEVTSCDDKPITCHDLQTTVHDNKLSGPSVDVPYSNNLEKDTDMSVIEHVEPEISLQSAEHEVNTEHAPSNSNLLTSKPFDTCRDHIPSIPHEKTILEKVPCNNQVNDNPMQPHREHAATSTEQPKSESVATVTEQPKSENVATSTEQPRREHVATSTKRPKKEHVATSTEEPKSENVATSTERPRSRSVATNTDEPFSHIATSTDMILAMHAAISIQSSFEEQDTAVTHVESVTQMPSEEHFQNQSSRPHSYDLPYDDHISTDNSDPVIYTNITRNEATVTGTDQSELDENTEDSSLQEVESSSDELPSTVQTSCFPF